MSDVKRFLAPTNDTCDMDSYQQVVLAADYDALLVKAERQAETIMRYQREVSDGGASAPTVLWDRNKLREERDQLRAELAVIRGQQAGWKLVPIEPTAEMIAAGFNAYPCNLARTYRVYVDAAPPPPQQPDAVSVPRELAERLEVRMAECSPMKEHWDTLEELRALLSTRQAEEGE